MELFDESIDIPEGVQVEVSGTSVTVKGPKGELVKEFRFPNVSYKVDGNKIVAQSSKATKREKALIFTFKAHLNNMLKGVQEPHTYTLKICSGHFPMNVVVSGKELVVKNFLGEKIPRKLKLKEGADVKVNDQEITVTGINIEIAGQVAADIEQLCRITNRDIRIFQDGIYIIKKSKD
ncbi:50S ribosomal protein L6 [Nanoarchaeota archaeon]